MDNRRILVFGPAYLDVVVEIDRPLVAGTLLDQSLPARDSVPREDARIVLTGDNDDCLVFPLSADAAPYAADYTLAEPVLARVGHAAAVTGEFPVTHCVAQPGGMGAGYALALGGLLCAPFGEGEGEEFATPDAVGLELMVSLMLQGVPVFPRLIAGCPSDTSLVIISPQGDKLAVGVRRTMTRWRPAEADRVLVEQVDGLVFCGAPNAFVAEVLSWGVAAPVMCAPALRNVLDMETPLASLAGGIDYLTLNALEWAHLAGREQVRARVPLISVTDGPRGSRLFLGDREILIPAVRVDGPVNANRAGETYGATIFSLLLDAFPGPITPDQAEMAGQRASERAAAQLSMAGFGFPGEDGA